jgi:DNA-binding transcriptional LysR family regulator
VDFKQLEALVRTIELSSFSRAAEVLYLSQPSVSHAVSSLEKELGTRLIVRTTKTVKATKNGVVFYEYAKNILSLRDKAVFSVQSRAHIYSGIIEIHASSVPAQYILPEVIVEFNKAYPNISFQIVMSDTFSIIDSVLAHNCELGVVGAKIDNNRCEYKHIVSESIILIAPPDCGMTAENLTETIYKQNFVMREDGSATRYHAEEFLGKLKIRPERLKVVALLSDTQSVIHAVSKGLGISIVSEIAARDYIRNGLVTVIKPNDVALIRDFYFVYRRDAILQPQIDLYMKYVCDYYAAPSRTEHPAGLTGPCGMSNMDTSNKKR